MVVEASFKSVGQRAFELYNAGGKNPGKTWDGKPVPTWEGLNDDVRAKWQAGAAGLLAHVDAIVRVVAESKSDLEEQERAEGFSGFIRQASNEGLPGVEEFRAAVKSEEFRAAVKSESAR